MRIQYFVILMIAFSSCMNSHRSVEDVKLNCSELSDLSKEEKLCMLLNMYDETCFNGKNEITSLKDIRIIVSREQLGTEIFTLVSNNEDFHITKKSIPPNAFSLFSICNKLSTIKFSVEKYTDNGDAYKQWINVVNMLKDIKEKKYSENQAFDRVIIEYFVDNKSTTINKLLSNKELEMINRLMEKAIQRPR